jgi:hypothetical protein
MEKVKKEETYSYKGWLISDNFWKRAFAVLGYYSVASMVVGAVFFVVMLVFILLGLAFFGIASVSTF